MSERSHDNQVLTQFGAYLFPSGTEAPHKVWTDLGILAHTDVEVGAVVSATLTSQEERTCRHLNVR